MKKKILKIMIVIMLLMTLNMANFATIGIGLMTYAISETETNHKNIDFSVGINKNHNLFLEIMVKNEGYFNGNITLENANFKLGKVESPYVNRIEKNVIKLNQLNAGTEAKIEIEIEPMKEEIYDIGLLAMETEIKLNGIYRDSTEKDINIKAEREIKIEIPENNDEKNIADKVEIITNKIMNISEEEKRIVQIAVELGLKENNYPIKEIISKIAVPEIDGNKPEIVKNIKFNTMTHYDYKYDGEIVEIKFTNEPNESNNIHWKQDGNERVVLTLIYDKDTKIEGKKLNIEQKVTLYNEKEIYVEKEMILDNEIKDSIVEVVNKSTEKSMYKGKIYAGINRQYETRTEVGINFAEIGTNIVLEEKEAQFVSEDIKNNANIIYNKTIIEKSKFDKILGEKGTIKIFDENNKLVQTVDRYTQTDEDKNIIINYNEAKNIRIEISEPEEEGYLEFKHIKTIKSQDINVVKNSTDIYEEVSFKYGEEIVNVSSEKIELKDTMSEVIVETNKDTFSTVVENNVEIRAILKTNSEQYNLYNNPTITIELPEEVENVEINSIDLFYESELKIANYDIEGKKVVIQLEGQQTQYKYEGILGATIILNLDAKVNKKSASKDAKILVSCENIGDIQETEAGIRIVAPKDVTAINNIKELSIETIGQEELRNVMIQRGVEAKQLETEIEVINNNENAIENVTIFGIFPTKNSENNIDIKILDAISIFEVEGVQIYYTENENATSDINNAENKWETNINDINIAKKYLIVIPKIEEQSSIKATYRYEVPELLEYNQIAKQSYVVSYINGLTRTNGEVKATEIEMQTGVGPVLETKLTATVAGTAITDNVEIRNGEVIKYRIEVSNTGSEDINNVEVKGNIPEGTTLVVPQENYEYTEASYYKELGDKEYSTTIDTIKVGDIIYKEYEVRVNSGVKAGTILNNTAKIKYDDVIKESNKVTNVTSNGDIRVSVKRITDRAIELYESGVVQYFAIIENISNQKQDNVKITTRLPEILEVDKLTLIKGMKAEEISDEDIFNTENYNYMQVETTEEQLEESTENDIETEELEYKDEINIGDLQVGETKVLSYDMTINKVIDGNNMITFAVSAKNGNEEIKSNIVLDNVRKVNVEASMLTNTSSKYVKAGDIIEYTLKINNLGTEDIYDLNIIDTIPNQLTVNKVIVDNNEMQELNGINEIEILCDIAAGEEKIVKIETVVNYSEARDEAEPITNIAYVEVLGDKIATTSEVSHIIEANESVGNSVVNGNDSDENEEENGNTEKPNEQEGGNSSENNDIAEGNKLITGMAWFDKNTNGKKDIDENTLSGIKVKILNAETNKLVKDKSGKILEAITNENGIYVLNNIGSGNYIILFEYNTSQYALTKYRVPEVEEARNSNAMNNQLMVNGETKEVASTDIIRIDRDNIEDINIGLIKLEKFDLKLEKFVNKIAIQDSKGTTVKEYNNATLAKVDLDAKKMNGATVIVEYTIKVSNIGEVPGYAKKIVDYIPNDLKFSSELNPDWYYTGEALYNSSIGNEKIFAGETREVTLVLTKAITENNVGLTNNTAEIAESYNELGIADNNSTAGNRAKGENDLGSADMILSIKTGGIVWVSIIIIITITLGVTAYIIIKKNLIIKTNRV